MNVKIKRRNEKHNQIVNNYNLFEIVGKNRRDKATLVGSYLINFLHPNDVQLLIDKLALFVDCNILQITHPDMSFVLRFLCLSGRRPFPNSSRGLQGIKTIHFMGTLWPDNDGRFIGFGQPMLQDGQNELILTSSMFMFRANLSLKLLFVDNRLMEISGYSHQKLLDNSLYKFVFPNDLSQVTEMHQIALNQGHSQKLLFIAGFGSSLIFGTFVGSFADKFGRKANCLLYAFLYSIACLTKHFSSFNILLIGRLLGGISTSILFSAFESWLICEHNKRQFDEEKLKSIFAKQTWTNSLIAILSGIFAQQVANLFGYVAPFDASFIILIFMGCMYVFVLEWTPALSRAAESEAIPHGYIFASFMLSVMAGSALFNPLCQRWKPEAIMRLTKDQQHKIILNSDFIQSEKFVLNETDESEETANVIAKLAKFPKGPPNDGKKEGKNDGGRIKAVSEKEFGGGINGIGKGKEVDWKNGGGLL
uniref:Molybdate-anion transporter n=1 Tax=Meloidogyne javanica TaxID=6303 RepID=A0A915MW62_MELJA